MYIKKNPVELEMKDLDLKRLFYNQKLELDLLEHYIVRDDLYDKNDCFNKLQRIISINLAILKKIENLENNEEKK